MAIDWRDRITIIGQITISVFVLTAFAAVCAALFFHEIPSSSHDIAIGLFGSLGTMSTGVVYFWTGSTSSSQKKDATIADTAKAAAEKVP